MAKSPELNIIPDGPDLYASESVVHMLAELNKRLEEAVGTSDRYREALTTILTDPDGMLCEHWDVARAALGLDGEGEGT